MGWLSEAHSQGRIRLGGSRNQRKGPLRKIVEVLRHSDNIFSRSFVRLECGHEVSSNGQYAARCSKCAAPTTPEVTR